MKKIWKVYAKKADFNRLGEQYKIDPVIARIIRNRDIIAEEDFEQYINGTRLNMYDAALMKDMDKAVEILLTKIDNNKKIRIIGDYDIDGVSSVFILLKGLLDMGGDVDYVIPHRVNDGYGINENLIKDAYDAGMDTLVTCDNGIAAVEQIKYAKSLGMTVVVTDHHDIRYEELGNGDKKYIIPDADAVVNPKRADCTYPFKNLCGAMVAYKLIEALYSRKLGLSKEELFSNKLRDLLEIGAIATIGDVMELKGENRIIVKEGLKLLRKTKNKGLLALMELNKLSPETLSAYHIGFVIGPCINASGRLDTAKWSLQLLMSKTREEAGTFAGDLVAFNDERKNLTLQQVEIAKNMVDTTSLKDDRVLVVYLPNCHESIAGIIAGRLREAYYKPTLVLTDSEEGIKGSGRSIEGYNMFEKLLEVSDLLDKFGGHPMAAGLSLKKENLEELRKRLNENHGLTEEDLTPIQWIDVAMPIDYITENFINQLQVLEPFGKGNEKPSFADRNLTVSQINIIGKAGNILKMKLTNERGITIDGIKFGADAEEINSIVAGDKISVIYYPSINEFNNKKTLQIIVNEIRK